MNEQEIARAIWKLSTLLRGMATSCTLNEETRARFKALDNAASVLDVRAQEIVKSINMSYGEICPGLCDQSPLTTQEQSLLYYSLE